MELLERGAALAAVEEALGQAWAGSGLDPARRADLLAALSVEAYPCGESQEPMTTRREALAIRHELGERRGEGVGERAIALAREIGDDEALAHALTNVGTALCATDRPARTSWRRPRASRCARVSTTTRRGRWSTWRNRLVHHRYEEGLVTIARGLEPAERCDLRSYGQYLIGMRSWAHLDTCDWPAAERDAEVAIAIHRAHPTTAAHPALVVMARLLTRRGDPRAGEVLDEAPAAGSPRPTRGSSARRSSGPGAPGPSRRCPWRRPSRGSHRSVATPAGRRSSGSASAARRRGSTRARRGQPRRGRRRQLAPTGKTPAQSLVKPSR